MARCEEWEGGERGLEARQRVSHGAQTGDTASNVEVEGGEGEDHWQSSVSILTLGWLSHAPRSARPFVTIDKI